MCVTSNWRVLSTIPGTTSKKAERSDGPSGDQITDLRWVRTPLCPTGVTRTVADSPPLGSYNLPSKQQTLTFLTETIEWYRHLSVERQVGTEPFDLLFFDNNQPIGAQIVQLSFDFAITAASLATRTQGSPPNQGGRIPNALSSDSLHLVQMEVKSEAESKKAEEDLKSIKTKLATARGADRTKLEAESADA